MKSVEEVKSWLEASSGKGFLPDLDIELYHHPDCPGYSKSALDKANKSLAHLEAYKRRPPEPKDWGNIGNAVHTAILQPEIFESKYIKLPEGVNFAMREGKQAKVLAECEGKTILRHDDYLDVIGMVNSVKKTKYAREFLYAGDAIVEGSAFWTDEDTGVQCKTRPDRLREDGIVTEIKTSESAHPDDFRWAMLNYRYHVQGAFQMDGVRAAMGRNPKFFVVVAIEKTDPYPVAVYAIEARAVELGRGLYKQNLIAIRQGQETGEWPGYPDRIETLDLPERAYQ